jgi:hypothetical protein
MIVRDVIHKTISDKQRDLWHNMLEANDELRACVENDG